ncbi:hypothetical protein AWB75_06398 [Caballeronia catudaia]|uniref:Transmembrane protein n=1 Tax=Caballeronia catudaia TaxID=1777136 RepID=A0A158DB55_9BURK|nr:hypothetical protein [Caballeronia catudaia]SAK91037.1 hypothetical protein AWB75_06398 [Caballeronia catudaia]
MPHQAKLPEESVADRASPANDPTVLNMPEPAIDYDDDAGPSRSPLRFGRLALWMASATALGIGVLGTVAYSMWFNHDQRVYAEAMASARKTLGIDQPVIAARTESSGMVEAPLTTTAPGYTRPYVATGGPAPVETAMLADNPPTADAADEPTLADASDVSSAAALATASAQAHLQQADDPSYAPPVRSAAVQRRGNASTQQSASNRANPSAQPRRHEARAKPEGGLFARMGAFFHRVSYRHNVPNRQREEYSRP